MRERFVTWEESRELDRKIRQGVSEGMDDEKIAAWAGRSRTTIAVRRRRLGLENGSHVHRRGGEYEREADSVKDVDVRVRVYRLICLGRTSEEIAEQEGLTILQVEVYRKQMPRWWGRDYKTKDSARIV